MRIAIFTNNYLPNPYGVTGSIESFRREFEKRGHEVYIFAPSFKGYQDKNPNVFRYPSFNIMSNGIKYPLGIPVSWRMGKLLKKLNIDVIHSQHPNLLGWAARRWAKKKKVPLVFTWHTLYDRYAHFAKFIPEKIASNYMINKAVKYANEADSAIVPTDSIIPVLRKWGVKKHLTPIATGVSEEEFQDPNEKMIREKHNVSSDEILLLLISRLTSEKNVTFVIGAAQQIIKKNKKVKLMVVGGGDWQGMIDERVIFTGPVSRDQIKHYYAAGDIFIYGSKSETQGLIITEAMYMGLPIVAVNATGTSSLVLNNGNGFLVNENEAEFIEAVEKLINDESLRRKFSEASKKIARTKFTSSVCADRLLEVYQEAIKNHSR